jgi:hypothetical protein
MTLRGFQLGMSLAEVKSRVPAAQFDSVSALELYEYGETLDMVRDDVVPKNDEVLSKEVFLHTILLNENAEHVDFAGVDRIDLYFTADKLRQILVTYSDSGFWASHDEFQETVIKKLSWGKWEEGGGGAQHRSLIDGDTAYERFSNYYCQSVEGRVITGTSLNQKDKKTPLYTMVLLSDNGLQYAEIRRQTKLFEGGKKALEEKIKKQRDEKKGTFKP